jgi:hypothetical protein
MTRVVTHLKSNVIAYLALFVALGGTSYAALRIPAHSVGNRQLKNHSVSPDKLDRSSIAGYVRDWAKISAQGKVVASRPRAHILAWRTTGPTPGGTVQWNRPIPASCFAVASTEVLPNPTASYASVEVEHENGPGSGQAAILLSVPQRPVAVAVLCPQR